MHTTDRDAPSPAAIEPSWLRLDGNETCLIVDLASGYPQLVHWGRPLPDEPEAVRALIDRPVPQASLDANPPSTLFNDAGRGFAGQPALQGDRDGRDWLTDLRIAGVSADRGEAELRLRDEHAAVEVVLSLALDRHDVLSVSSQVVNRGDADYRLDWLASACLPLPARLDEAVTFGGRWCQEFGEHRRRLHEGALTLDNRRGRASHQRFPGLLVGTPGFTERHGEVIAAHLAWSGNHRLLVERQFDGSTQLQLGALLMPGEIRLAPGAAFAGPRALFAWSDAGINPTSQRLHAHLRERLDWPDAARPRPVHINTWEALYFDHDAARLTELVEAASEVGAERFVLDDGWFLGRDGERAALGDWSVDPDKYPQGLGPLIEHVRARGMEFGLWVEPEMVNPDSELYRAHPDWILGLPGRDQPLGRYQCVLDLTRPEVADYLFARLDALLTEYPIAYLKWDMNRDLTHAASQAGAHAGRAAMHGQVEGLYALLARLRAAHPGVEIESCASGGARADHGILAHTHRVWTSDCNDPHERVLIQRGAGRFLPPELLGSHIGPELAHTTGRRTSLDFRAAVALFGHLGLELDVSRLDAEEKQRLRWWIDTHKRHRALLHGGTLERLDTQDANAHAHGVVSRDRREALFGFAQLAMPRHAIGAPQPLAGLDPETRYRVRLITPPEHPERRMKRLPAGLEGDGVVISGVWLMRQGLQLPIMDPEQALLVHLRAADDGAR